jgi:hypothetical protein
MQAQVQYGGQEFKDEYDFQMKLCSIFENEPYNHTVYVDRIKQGYGDYGYELKQFGMRGTRCRIDVYMRTSPEWEHHELFPVIGIELKASRSLGKSVVEAFGQVKKYSEELPHATYTINGQTVPTPNIYLLATPESFYEGHIYKWPFPSAIPYTEAKRVENPESGWIGITEFCNKLLMKHGAAVLREKYFITNKIGKNGEKGHEMRFNLWT